jgi:hypothetical protein
LQYLKPNLVDFISMDDISIAPHSKASSIRRPFQVAVVGPLGDCDQCRALIGHAKRFECAVTFAFAEIEGDNHEIPPNTDAVLLCGVPPPPNWMGACLSVALATDQRGVVSVDLATGSGVGLALATIVATARGTDRFRFRDGGRTLQLDGEAAWGVNICNCSEAARTVRIVIASSVTCVGGIWSPLLPKVKEIVLHDARTELYPRTFAGLTVTSITVASRLRNSCKALGRSCLAFDSLPWRIVFREGETIKQALADRNPKKIRQLAGFIPPECFSWTRQRKCQDFAFAGAKFQSFAFQMDLKQLGRGAFAGSLLERIVVPDSVCQIGEYCFAYCGELREVSIRSPIRMIPASVFEGCRSLQTIRLLSGIEKIDARAFAETASLREFDFTCLAPGAAIAMWAFTGSGLASIALESTVPIVCCTSAFSNCESLRHATLNCSVVASGLFCSCTALECVSLTSPVSIILAWAFSGCTALRNVDFTCLTNNAVISMCAFSRSGLAEIELPTELGWIRRMAFAHCTSLVSVRLPEQLDIISAHVFLGCNSLQYIAMGMIRQGKSEIENELREMGIEPVDLS